MMAKKTQEFIFFYLSSIVFDLITTYLSTPDLAREGAIDVKLFHLGWFGIISTSILYFIMVSLFFRHANEDNSIISHIPNYKAKIWIRRISWMTILNLTISHYLAAINNFLYYLEKNDAYFLKSTVKLHVKINDYLYCYYDIIYIHILSTIVFCYLFFYIKEHVV